MAGDVALGAAFCAQRCASWGGDSSRVLLVGQSAGAHLAALALMRAAKEEEEEAAADADAAELTPPPPPAAAAAAAAAAPRLSPRSFARFVGISGVYTPDDPLLLDHFERRGLDRPLLYAIMEAGLDGRRAAAALPAASPVAQLRAPGAAAWAARLPGVTLLHGGADASAPPSQSAALAAALRAAGRPPSSVAELYYEGKTHTDPFLEDPVLGGRDVLMEDLLRLVGAPPPWPVFRRMQPAASVRLARRCIPF